MDLTWGESAPVTGEQRLGVDDPRRSRSVRIRRANHTHAVAIHFYNFARIHRTLRVTPAMAAGVTTRLWEVADLVALLETSEFKKAA